jgi:hypothetical protein
MDKPPVSSLRTLSGIRKVADWLKHRADSGQCPETWKPGVTPPVSFGPFKIHDNITALWRAAELLRSNATYSGSRGSTAIPDSVWSLQAVRAYGSPEAGLAAIRRQLAIQACDMDPADVKRCERAACMIERHLAEEAELKRDMEEAEAEAAVFKAARPADPDAPPTIGSTVYVSAAGRAWKGTVLGVANKRDAVLGKTVPHVQVQLTHRRETDGRKIYGFHPGKGLVKRWEPCRYVLVPS